jgi:hypothetical protein
MTKSDTITILQIAYEILRIDAGNGLIGRELDLSDDELDRIFNVIETELEKTQ